MKQKDNQGADDAQNSSESRHILNRVSAEAETFLTRRHSSAIPDEDDDDPRLLFWARLTGRSLGVMFVIYLLWSLYNLFSA